MAQGSGNQVNPTTPNSNLSLSGYSGKTVVFAFNKSTEVTNPHYKIFRQGTAITDYHPESYFAQSGIDNNTLLYTDTNAPINSNLQYRVSVSEDNSGTNESTMSMSVMLQTLALTVEAYQPTTFTPVSTNPYNYVASGGIGVHRLRQQREGVIGGMEVYQSMRKTKWFPLRDYENDAKLRRVRLNYKSNRPVTVCIYADFQDNPTHTLVFPQAGNQKMRYQKATLRAKMVQVEIKSPNTAGHILEIYGMELLTDG